MTTVARACIALGVALACSRAEATIYNGIDFPQGAASFADQVVSFTPGTFSSDASAFTDPTNALGPPDVNTSNGLQCFLTPTPANCKFTSLGNGGVLVLKFTDNVLTGSSPSGSVTGAGDGKNDLFLVEVGVSEATSIDISKDGTTWVHVGDVTGGQGNGTGIFNYGFDIDKLGYGVTDSFMWVRVNDVVNGDQETSPEGADIDAVGAIQTVPAPAAVWLLGSAVVLLFGQTRRRR